MSTFWERAEKVARCEHRQHGPVDANGEAICGDCGVRFVVRLTERGLMRTVNAMARQMRGPEPFPDLGPDGLLDD